MPSQDILPGLLALHGNHAETLAQTLVAWLQRQPLEPLETEAVLVQSHGMGEWFKMLLAREAGVCAAVQVELPSRFLWRTSRQILGPAQVPRESPLDKLPLTWRLMQILPQCVQAPVFAPLRPFLHTAEPERCLQLCERLADVFDQYQFYRADWLHDWAAGRDVCRHSRGQTPLDEGQRWQAELWRCVLASLSPAERQATRPALHQRVLEHLHAGLPPAQPVARRVSVFGMSHMPQQWLEMLAALAQHSQVLLAVPNPCRFHWAEIMDGREVLRTVRQRHADKGPPLHSIDLSQMHLHAPTLLSAWGRQGRDFVRMLDAFDQAQSAGERAPLPSLDCFDDAPIAPGTPMLAQLQRRIRDLVPSTPEHPAQPLPQDDASLLFRIAHSPVRELEVLHDQLLDWFKQAPGQPSAERPAERPGHTPLAPREVVVMVPDIARMAPAIEAVFGQYAPGDARHIPYAVADVGAEVTSPLVHAVHWLLRLPQSRVQMSELADLLELPALARRFGLSEQDLPGLTHWMAGAGVRWGLHAEHRAGLGLDACGQTHSLLFGLQRMLMGYACGADPLPEDAPWADLVPYDEVAGLEAERVGALGQLFGVLSDWWQVAQDSATPLQWAERARTLLAQCFEPSTQADRQALDALLQALETWLRACEGAAYEQAVPLAVMRQAWEQALRMPQMAQRFRSGGVTFCTLMPMRAIPFRVVCLLGMNDGDYPRRAPQADFDLMAQPGMARPGDRARRDDDRQLMLEALLSARDALYISWSGRSVRDNSEQPPSVLVSQLRDEVALLWGQNMLQGLTVAHPLQPFGRAYFTAGSGLHTYAHEWQAVAGARLDTAAQLAATGALAQGDKALARPASTTERAPEAVLDLQALARFLRRPAGTFFRQRLQVNLEPPATGWLDEERFALDRLDEHQLLAQALAQLLGSEAEEKTKADTPGQLQAMVQRWRRSGALSMAGVGALEAARMQALLQALLHTAQTERSRWAGPAPRVNIDATWRDEAQVPNPTVVHLRDALAPLWRSPEDQQAPLHLLLSASKLAQLHKTQPPTLYPEKLLDAWLCSLATAAQGQPVRVVVVGRNALVRAPVWTQAPQKQYARAVLQALLHTWCEGQRSPLPLPPALALAWCRALDSAQATTPQDEALSDAPSAASSEALRAAYEDPGHGGAPALVRQDPALYRCYPTLHSLVADGRFEALAERIYRPLLAWAAQCEVQPLDDPLQGLEGDAPDADNASQQEAHA